jgi:predicted alpha/beta-fold hydrolase
MSVPYDLAAGARHLERTMGRLYVGSFVKTLSRKAAALTQRFGALGIDLARAARARTFYEFDGAATAPLHGFTSAEDYWNRSSSIHLLDRITTPTLCISAIDDPFIPREALERARAAASPAVTFEVTESGGHTGFIGGTMPWRSEYWAEERLVSWLVESVRDDQR